MVRSINEPHSTAEVSTNMPESINELPPAAAVVTEDGTTMLNGEVIPPANEPELEPELEPEVKQKQATPPLGLLSPVDESGLTDFINTGRPN